ncbi:MAG TPA: choice-of-anchor tandem repeat GloVer-containing protein [Terriglobales bacterium]|nr:choice-of-anchor tandem repeat GloVer-containing protein [Terriglobales bacterium]
MAYSHLGLRTSRCVFCSAFLVFLIAALCPGVESQTYSVLHTFCSQADCADGAYPYSGVMMDSEGNLYGTTALGGLPDLCTIAYSVGCGVVFKLDMAGNETALYAFSAPDGDNPEAGLIRDANNNLYGMTLYGGNENRPCNTGGCGVVFRVTPGGAESVLYAFKGEEDGAFPSGSLLFDTAGNLYGTTQNASNHGPREAGVVFRLAANGEETVLHTFPAYKGDGRDPNGFLLLDAQGNLYGTTVWGGHEGLLSSGNHCEKGCGTIYKINASGEESVVYRFKGYKRQDGAAPSLSFIDSHNNLYGETGWGGRYGYGTIFALTPSGSEKLLYAFTNRNDGSYPNGQLVQDEQGNLYGTTLEGGAYGYGTIFELTASGTLHVIFNFPGGTGGEYPYGLFRDTEGNLYGTAGGGVANPNCYAGCGIVFKLTP